MSHSDERSGISRRDLLRGRLRFREPAPCLGVSTHSTATPETTSAGSAKPLPAVISWLEPAIDRPSDSTPSGVQTFDRIGARRRGAAPLRPPGAIDEEGFLDRCTRCGKCTEACPHRAIHPAPPRFGAARDTPWIDPYQAPCRMCEDFPCVQVCEPKALLLDRAGPIGTALVRELDCLNRLGSPCSACIEHCPVPDALTLRGSVPSVEPALCTGCGLCAYVCPAPDKAILLLPAPRLQPPSAPASRTDEDR